MIKLHTNFGVIGAIEVDAEKAPLSARTSSTTSPPATTTTRFSIV
jgi:hypothetical protein